MSNVDRDRWSQYILWTILNINLSRLYSARLSICFLKKKNVNTATTRFTASFFQPVKASKIQNKKKKVNVDGTELFTFRLKENQVIS